MKCHDHSSGNFDCCIDLGKNISAKQPLCDKLKDLSMTHPKKQTDSKQHEM